jgi:cellulose synthase/poly-beta-1,6-N-acetylglucosamine synthase-like glycosyltransferase
MEINNNDKKYISDYFYKIIIYFFLSLFILFIYLNIKFFPKNILRSNEIKPFIRYINDCKNHERYNRIKILNKNPYISICLPALNMNKYIEQTILSIINQSFQDFEIIIINDNSKDDTEKILKKMQLEDNRIKIINHYINRGVYYSRVEAILNSKGKYVILNHYA